MIALGDGLAALLGDARRVMRPIPIDSCPQTERLELAAAVARGILGELRQAYAEQTSPLLARHGRAPNYRLCLDDLVFGERWVASLAYRADLAAWQAEPENRAAQTMAAACTDPAQRTMLPDDAKRRLDAQPREVPLVTLRNAPDGWPHEIVAWSWSETFSRLLELRRERAGVLRLDREPGDDDEPLGVTP